ncbi:hypothetical protein P4409_22855, partial [Bacillus thuringiensis]|nr:hypothetical protein [Bacillus thuringiensis]
TNVVTVDKNGNWKAVKEGTTTITVTSANGKTAEVTIIVKSEITDAEVISWHSTGQTWIKETLGLTYTVGFNWHWNGNKSKAQEAITSYTLVLNGRENRTRTFPFADVDKSISGFYFAGSQWSTSWSLGPSGLMQLYANLKNGKQVLVVQKWV